MLTCALLVIVGVVLECLDTGLSLAAAIVALMVVSVWGAGTIGIVPLIVSFF